MSKLFHSFFLGFAFLLAGSVVSQQSTFAAGTPQKFKGGTVLAKAYYCSFDAKGNLVKKRKRPFMVMLGSAPFCNAKPYDCYNKGMDYIEKKKLGLSKSEIKKLAKDYAVNFAIGCAMNIAAKGAAGPVECAKDFVQQLAFFYLNMSHCTRGHHVVCAARYHNEVICDRFAKKIKIVSGAGKQCFWFGTAPACGGSKNTCRNKGLTFNKFDKRGEGKRCTSGNKVYCCAPQRIPPGMERRCSVQYGREYRGGDFSSYKARNLDDCKQHCKKDLRCKGFTFDTTSAGRRCWLKRRLGGIKSHTYRASGSCKLVHKSKPREVRGKNCEKPRYGYDYKDKTYSYFRAKDVSDCRRRCSLDKKCYAWTYHTRKRTCWKKSQAAGFRAKKNRYTGKCTNQKLGRGLKPPACSAINPRIAATMGTKSVRSCIGKAHGKPFLALKVGNWRTCSIKCKQFGGHCKSWVSGEGNCYLYKTRVRVSGKGKYYAGYK